MHNAADRPLTDLEGAVLAVIARRGEATAYQVAKQFESSPSEYWSGSAGAVYPLVERLRGQGLVDAELGAQGKRARTRYRLSEAGAAAYRAWLFDCDRAAGMGFDPLRTRMVYLAGASSLERRAFLEQVEARLVAFALTPGFPEDPELERLHQSWLEARLTWVRRLMQT
jgi:DNA-binding PadR family transcriptional regulator